MRTLRLSLAAVITSALLGGFGGAVVAQDETRTLTRADAVAGTIVWRDHGEAPTISFDGGVQRTEGLRWEFSAIASDPRVDGTLSMLGETRSEFPGSITITSGPVELVNADGRWSGEWRGGYEHAMGWKVLGFLQGEGAYDGLTYLIHIEHDQYDTNDLETHGIIYPGDIPGPTDEELPAE